MTRKELIALLEAHEWRDLEFKEARRGVPRSAYETVSAFANTEGGHLVFGVRQDGQDVQIVGVLDVDKVQSDFLTTVRQPEKVSVVLDVQEELHNFQDADLLIFHVPEAHRSDKPVYLNGDIRRSFVRRGGSDMRCSESERDRFLMDAAADRYDGQPVEFNLNTAFDAESLQWYRAVYEGRPGNRSYASLSDLDFLEQMGLLVERGGDRLATRAAILLFGTNPRFRQLLSRPVVDCQRYRSRQTADNGERWFDRLVLEENLIRTWWALIEWYDKLADHPFRLDPATMLRDETPPDYHAFREAMVNMVVHQDYAVRGLHAVICHYPDQTVFRNPGDAFATDVDLLEPGEKEVRNPRLALAFRRIGLSENAGWGLRDVFRNWLQLGHVPPTLANDKRRKRFELSLVKQQLVTDQLLNRVDEMGLRLIDAPSGPYTRVFASACREREVTLAQIKMIADLPAPEATALARELVAQGLLEEAGPSTYALAAHLRERLAATDQATPTRHNMSTEGGWPIANLVTGQTDQVTKGRSSTAQPTLELGPTRLSGQSNPPEKPGPSIVSGHETATKNDMTTEHDRPPETDLVTGHVTKLNDQQRRLIAACDTPKSLVELMAIVGVTHRSHFRTRHLKPLLDDNIIRMTNPARPRAANQRYVLTEGGVGIRAFHFNAEQARKGREQG